MVEYKKSTAQLLLLSSAVIIPASGFIGYSPTFRNAAPAGTLNAATVGEDIDARTGKATGTSFLPKETLERALAGNKIEKTKLAKDPTSAFVDVYEYARKIREGEMTWEEVEKADMDTVSCFASINRFPRYILYALLSSHSYIIIRFANRKYGMLHYIL